MIYFETLFVNCFYNLHTFKLSIYMSSLVLFNSSIYLLIFCLFYLIKIKICNDFPWIISRLVNFLQIRFVLLCAFEGSIIVKYLHILYFYIVLRLLESSFYQSEITALLKAFALNSTLVLMMLQEFF